jgi:hypothetical protein
LTGAEGFAAKYGRWAVIAGASEDIGAWTIDRRSLVEMISAASTDFAQKSKS